MRNCFVVAARLGNIILATTILPLVMPFGMKGKIAVAQNIQTTILAVFGLSVCVAAWFFASYAVSYAYPDTSAAESSIVNNPPGVYLILELENSGNVNQYTVFNSAIKNVEICEQSADAFVQDILATAPPEVPKDSRIKSWRCSLVPPEKGG